MKGFWILIFLVMVAGCERNGNEREVRIAVSLAGNEPFTLMQYTEGLKDAAGDESITISWKSAMTDIELQSRQIDTLLAGNPDIIAIGIADYSNPGDISEKLKDAGIPVIGFNLLIPEFQYDLVLTPDFKAIGKELADIIIQSGRPALNHILLLRSMPESHGDSLVTYNFLNSIARHEELTVQVIELPRTEGDSSDRSDQTGLSELLTETDAAIGVNSKLTRTLAAHIVLMDRREIEHRSPLIAGIGNKEYYSMFDYNNFVLIDEQPYESSRQLITAAAGFVRGNFKHHDGDVLQFNEFIYPVIYTPHRIATE